MREIRKPCLNYKGYSQHANSSRLQLSKCCDLKCSVRAGARIHEVYKQRRRRGMPASACCIFTFFPIHARALLASQRCRNWFKEVATTNAEVLLCVILPISTKLELVPVLLVLLMYRNEVSRVSIWSSTAGVLLLAGINKVRDYHHHWWAGHRFRAWIVKSLSGLFTGPTKEKESTCEYVDGS